MILPSIAVNCCTCSKLAKALIPFSYCDSFLFTLPASSYACTLSFGSSKNATSFVLYTCKQQKNCNKTQNTQLYKTHVPCRFYFLKTIIKDKKKSMYKLFVFIYSVLYRFALVASTQWSPPTFLPETASLGTPRAEFRHLTSFRQLTRVYLLSFVVSCCFWFAWN